MTHELYLNIIVIKKNQGVAAIEKYGKSKMKQLNKLKWFPWWTFK